MTDGNAGVGAPAALPTVGRWCWLRPLTDSDAEFIYRAELTGANLTRYRFAGRTPSRDQVWASFFQGVECAFAVCRRGADEPLGTAVVFDADYRNGHAKLAAAMYDKQLRGWPLEGVALAIDYAFRVFNLRKLYLDVLEFNLPQFGSAVGTLFEVEGRLRDHHYLDGEYWDMAILSIEQASWKVNRPRLLGHLK